MKTLARFQIEADKHRGGGGKRFSRADFDSSSDARKPSAFLGKLAALFGPPTPIDGGFSYTIRDLESDVTFTAYSGASGPSYGANSDVEHEKLRLSIAALEELLAAVNVADCSVELTEDADYGGDSVRVGVRGGEPFREPLKTKAKAPSLRNAKTYEDCVAVVTARAGGYGIEAGWELCIDKALPPVPECFEMGGRRYENCVGFSFSSGDKQPVYLFDEGLGLEEVPVETIPWATPLSSTAKLLLSSYATWRRTSRPSEKC